jgi:hypothetical protein
MSNLFQTIAAILAALAMLDSNAGSAQSAAKQPFQHSKPRSCSAIRAGLTFGFPLSFFESHAAQREASRILPR